MSCSGNDGTAWCEIDHAPSNQATCKYAGCQITGGGSREDEAGAIAKGAMIVVPINTLCGTRLGYYHTECFFRSQMPEAFKTRAWTHTSPFTNNRFSLVQRRDGDVHTRQREPETPFPPLKSVSEMIGFGSLSEKEKKQLLHDSELQGTGTGTKMKNGKRIFDANTKVKKEDADEQDEATTNGKRGQKRKPSMKKPANANTATVKKETTTKASTTKKKNGKKDTAVKVKAEADGEERPAKRTKRKN